jgi:adenine-specific DNA-methyltransferase
MKKLTAEDPETKSADIVAENVEHLNQLFPEAFTEGRIDFAVLKQLLGGAVDDSDEKYGLNWHGKRAARRLALTPSTGTLRPCPDESVDWETTQNLMIEGDNLEVLKLLLKSYDRKVKAIYIDPPYNTGNDLIYPNDFSDPLKTYLEITGQAKGSAKLISNTETGGRYHTNWLSMMYPRLLLARRLLRQDGVLICTIDENEQPTLSLLLQEVFETGSYEHVCVTVVHNPRGIQGENFSYTHEYAIFVFPRGSKSIGNRRIEPSDIDWRSLRDNGGESLRTDARNCFYPIRVQGGSVVGFGEVCKDDDHPKQTVVQGDTALVYPIDKEGIERKWRYARQSVEGVAHLLRAKKTWTGYEIEIGKDFGSYRTVWLDKRYDANENGTKLVNELVEDSPFSFPKSLWTVYDSLYAAVGEDKDALVMDFFAGSGTTGHATLALNANDGGNRHFVLVQLPEQIDGSRYKTVADVTKQRLRQAAAGIKRASPLFAGDTGFRVFKLASSNLHAWDPDRDNIAKSLTESIDHLKTDRTEADILYELLLKLGLDLRVSIERRQFAGKEVHAVGGGVLLTCLAEKIGRTDAEPLALGIVEWHKALAPAGDVTCVFRDSAFADDVAKSNLAAILEQHGLTNVRSL